MSVQVIDEQEIRKRLRLADLIEPVRSAFIGHSRGLSSSAISHLQPTGGEVHIKSGYAQGSPFYVVKVVSGFPANVTRNLAVWDGVLAVFNSDTGAMVAIIEDHGLLTDWRTAAAGAIATQAFVGSHLRQLGIVGSGLQAFWQPLAHKAVVNFEVLAVWARNTQKTEHLCDRLRPLLQGVHVYPESSLEDLVRKSDAIVTATASIEPLIRAEWILSGKHITALGADTEMKRELETEVLIRAATIAVDSIEANHKYGEIARAVREGVLPAERVRELGQLLADPKPLRRTERDITVAKLVGIGAQDLAAVTALLAET